MENIRVQIVNKPLDIQNRNKDYEELSNVINSILSSVKEQAIKWNAKVQQVFTESGNFSFNAVCDNEELQQKMQKILNDECKRIANLNEPF